LIINYLPFHKLSFLTFCKHLQTFKTAATLPQHLAAQQQIGLSPNMGKFWQTIAKVAIPFKSITWNIVFRLSTSAGLAGAVNNANIANFLYGPK
jgi:hypothetical protein